jgi:hypothetical protein
MSTSLSSASLATRAVQLLQGLGTRRDVPDPSAPNMFLDGVFAPVDHETTATSLEVVGELPVALNGLYARIGPNPLKQADRAKYHWFIGDGMVHGLRLHEGKALWYHSRWIGSPSVNKALGRPLVPGQKRGVSDVVNTNVYGPLQKRACCLSSWMANSTRSDTACLTVICRPPTRPIRIWTRSPAICMPFVMTP